MSLSKPIVAADLFCGAGGTSSGLVQAVENLGLSCHLTAVNHWPRAVETHALNHPAARHLCASLDSLNPRELFRADELDILWASPECTHHSRARGGKPMHDQSRATAWCVARWAEALRPGIVMIENVPEFQEWGPLGSDGKPLQSRKGDTFRAWVESLRSMGYRVDWRELCAADFGDPTTRRRLFVQAVRGRRRITWPEPTHTQEADLFGRPRWKSARDVIDWSHKGISIFARKRPLAARTMDRIWEGLRRYGITPTLVCMEHGGRVLPIDAPVPTITTARAGAMAVVEPFVIEYYGTGGARPISEPLPTVTTHDRFALVEVDGKSHRLDIRFRMLTPAELAGAQGFPSGYKFTGTKAEQVKQIGNAVPCGLSRALVTAALTQNSGAATHYQTAA